MARLDELFVYLRDNSGSDLHVTAGQPPRIRLHGHLEPIPGWSVLDDGQVRELMREIASERVWKEFTETRDADFAYRLEGVARFRANYFVQHNGAACVFRMIPTEILPLSALNVPPAVERLAHMTSGLVLVTGPTGSGKSTTLAAIIDVINSTYARHIITIEDPIEFVHPIKKSIITQREVGSHTEDFAAALRSAIREDPDVILVGEMRDLETISLAMTSAEMGALVFGTLHTNNAAKTIDRVIDAFPAEQQHQARSMLAGSLRAVISQLLLRRADGEGRVAAMEILLHTTGLPNLIREGNIPMLKSVIQSGKKDGMQPMDDALMGFLEQGVITAEAAYLKAADKSRFEKLLGQDSAAPPA